MSSELHVEQYWPFAAICAVALLLVVRLLLRERIALEGSLSFLVFLGVFLLAALLPNGAAWLAHAMGFTLLANFLFSAGLIALALLHLRVLVALSRSERRTLRLTQELAILEERLERAGIRR